MIEIDVGTRYPLGERIRLIRMARKVSRSKLARDSGVSRNTIANIEDGAEAKVSTIMFLAIWLDVPVHILFFKDRDWFNWFNRKWKGGIEWG